LPAEAQNPAAEERPVVQPAAVSVTRPDAEAVRKRVATALHANPYFLDRHVAVSVEDGRIVLRGIVFSDWDLQEALRLARESAGAMDVVDDLSIEEGGR
jgi:osmotically-inducible protein OsmY